MPPLIAAGVRRVDSHLLQLAARAGDVTELARVIGVEIRHLPRGARAAVMVSADLALCCPGLELVAVAAWWLANQGEMASEGQVWRLAELLADRL